MKEIWESLRDQVSQRIRSPIFGSFIISWICWNHEFLMVLFSGGDVRQRLILTRSLYGDWFDVLIQAVTLPAFTSVAYVMLYPVISRPFLLYWEWQTTILENRLNESQKKRRLTEEESQALVLRVSEQRAKYEKNIAELRKEIEVLSERLSERKPAHNLGGSPSLEELQNRVFSDEEVTIRLRDLSSKDKAALRAVLNDIASSQSSDVSENQILVKVDRSNRPAVRLAISHAVEFGFIREVRNEGGYPVYQITRKGLEFSGSER